MKNRKNPACNAVALRADTFTTILLALGFLALSPVAQAVVPPPDGGYPNFTTAEGTKALFSLTTGAANTAVGWFSLFSDSAGSFNTATGAGTLLFNTADDNTAFGAAALLFNTTGTDNTALGTAALVNNSMGADNTAVGAFALNSNTGAGGNTATGFRALASATTGGENTATGADALSSNTQGAGDTANGVQALFSNTIGFSNTAIGHSALFTNTDGDNNTAVGVDALHDNVTGDNNTANGFEALANNTTGDGNTANGYQALFSNTGTANGNTAIGYQALLNNTTGAGNTALGVLAGTGVSTAQSVICIGATGANVDNSCFISNIYSNVQPIVGTDPDSVTITSTGRLGRGNVSSRRYKHDIKPMNKASEVLYALKPVSFRYNEEYDATQTLAFGLVAEEVAEVYPDLVGRNPEGQPESVRYEQINAMLLNEFLKEHKKVEEQAREMHEQQATIAELKSTVARQEVNFQSKLAAQGKQIEGLASNLERVSARLEGSKPATRVALNSQ
jgi:hypothetical protein